MGRPWLGGEAKVETMSSKGNPVFVICSAKSIAPGAAKSFSLSRITENGEARPFPIVIVRTDGDEFVGYVNSCPHNGIWLNFNAGEFFNEDHTLLKCGRHGAEFEITTGTCIEGPCTGKSLEPLALTVIEGEVCLCGIALVEDNGIPGPFDELEDTMEIMIHPD
jgi:nitrite reductase/ring-hydroxylating ferredoxin subunit